jgi:hypothetical protein
MIVMTLSEPLCEFQTHKICDGLKQKCCFRTWCVPLSLVAYLIMSGLVVHRVMEKARGESEKYD